MLNNVNADPQILTSAYLDKVAALAKVFRPYGITVYLSAQFGAPKQIGGLSTADPLNSGVKQWWADLTTTIYQKIPVRAGTVVGDPITNKGIRVLPPGLELCQQLFSTG